MPSYEDKRRRYAGRPPWDIPSGSARGDNPVPTKESSTTTASRGPAPSGAFRVLTTEDPAELLLRAIAADAARRREEEAAMPPPPPNLKHPLDLDYDDVPSVEANASIASESDVFV